MSNRRTRVSIAGDRFLANGAALNAGRRIRGIPIDGLLLNSRMVQGIFDDLNPATRDRWRYPDGTAFCPDRNTREFIEAMPSWAAAGLNAFTINLQGGSPQGYSKEQPWLNSALADDGSLRGDYMRRLAQILDRADELGLIVILGIFYFGQEPHLADEQAILQAVDDTVDWLMQRGDTNVLIEVGNESDCPRYRHPISAPPRVAELIHRVRERSAGKLLASTSLLGGRVVTPEIAEASDFILIHGNSVHESARLAALIEACRRVPTYRGQPIVCNEDDHFDFHRDDCNCLTALRHRCGWGYFDFRREGEPFEVGFQSVPVDWTISTDRKRAFFDLLRSAEDSPGPG
jgi:hypothetical protein